MITLAWALAQASAVPTLALIDPIETFRAVCLDGGAHFEAGAIKSVSPNSLPRRVKSEIRSIAGVTAFQSVGGSKKITILTAPAAADGSQYCAVVSDKLKSKRLSSLGFPVSVEDNSLHHYYIDHSWTTFSPLGYKLRATRLGREGMIIESFILPVSKAARQKADIDTITDSQSSDSARDSAFQRLQKRTDKNEHPRQ